MPWRSLLVCCLVALTVPASALGYDRSEFLFLDEIRIGMTGVGKTIVAKDIIEEFAVEVIGILDEPGTLSDFVVVRVSGEAIGRAGGIAQGMSGSPIYIDGKLVGALSRAANWSKEITPIGLVTPIEPMLAVIDGARGARASAGVEEPDEASVLDGVALVDGVLPPDEALVAALPDVLFAYPVDTPLIASGLSSRAQALLMDGASLQDAPRGWIGDFLRIEADASFAGLSALGLSLLPIAASQPASSPVSAASLLPGSSVGVALTTGDLSIGALGTLTYRDGDALVGFGHPFIANGASQFPMTTVSIIDTMKSLAASFKLGSLGETIGTILEDRLAAIGGRIGVQPDMIELLYEVRDTDRDAAETFEVEMVDEPHLAPELLLATGFEAIDRALDRIGPGTVEVSYRIIGDGMSHPLERKDIYLSSVDIAVYPPWQLAGLVSYLQYSALGDPAIRRIEASMSVTEEIRAIRIHSLSLDEGVYSPGDTVRFRLELQTFQGTMRVEEGELFIPRDLDSDYVIVRAYSGPRYIESGEAPPVFADLDALIDAVASLPSYDRLTVELFAVDPYSPYGDALYGVTEITFDYPGYVVYNEWEASALLTAPPNGSEIPSDGKSQTGPNG